MIILWELDGNGNLVSVRKRSEKSVDADTLAAKIVQPLVSELVVDYGWDPAERAISALDQQVETALHHAVRLHEQEKKFTLEGRLASFGSPAFSPDGITIIYLSQNETTQREPRQPELLPCVNLWNVESRSLQHQLLGHTDAIMWAAMSPDNLLVASIAWDGTARVWNARSGVCLHVLGPFGGQLRAGAFSSNGKYLSISQGSPQSCIHVYDIESGQPVSRFDGFHGWARSLDWSPDGTMIACGGNRGELFILDPSTGEERMRWRLAFEDVLMRGFAGIQGVQFVDGGRKLIFQIWEGTVETYDFESNRKKQFTRRAEDRIESFPLSEKVCSLSSGLLIVPDADGILRLWDL